MLEQLPKDRITRSRLRICVRDNSVAGPVCQCVKTVRRKLLKPRDGGMSRRLLTPKVETNTGADMAGSLYPIECGRRRRQNPEATQITNVIAMAKHAGARGAHSSN